MGSYEQIDNVNGNTDPYNNYYLLIYH